MCTTQKWDSIHRARAKPAKQQRFIGDLRVRTTIQPLHNKIEAVFHRLW